MCFELWKSQQCDGFVIFLCCCCLLSMKAYVGVEVYFYAFLTLVSSKGEPVRNLCVPQSRSAHAGPAGNGNPIVQPEESYFID
jgi:hypothetical protein